MEQQLALMQRKHGELAGYDDASYLHIMSRTFYGDQTYRYTLKPYSDVRKGIFIVLEKPLGSITGNEYYHVLHELANIRAIKDMLASMKQHQNAVQQNVIKIQRTLNGVHDILYGTSCSLMIPTATHAKTGAKRSSPEQSMRILARTSTSAFTPIKRHAHKRKGRPIRSLGVA